jgi:type VI secretion system secreted protein VgrG
MGKQQRGEGFELRTDMWGAIRAKKGIFISADGQERAQGQVREMAAALSELQCAQSLVEALRSAAEVAKAELADVQAQQALLAESLTELKQAALLLSAPEGIAQVTPKSIQLSAGENLVSTGGQHADFSVLKKFTVAAGKRSACLHRSWG